MKTSLSGNSIGQSDEDSDKGSAASQSYGDIVNFSALRSATVQQVPFRHLVVDGLLDADFAREVAQSYPAFDAMSGMGKRFEAINERNKIQITDSDAFPVPVKHLANAINSLEMRETLSKLMGIDDLLGDDDWFGGGMHATGAHGHLDVHVDFNMKRGTSLYRRLNLLIYLNEDWKEEWGGNVELWDKEVKNCHVSLPPVFNRCVIFETSEISFHGVTAVTCPEERMRQSFAAYYYTQDLPKGAGSAHTTVFKARPDEHAKRYAMMASDLKEKARQNARKVLSPIKSLFNRD